MSELNDNQRRIYAVVTHAPRTTNDIAARAGLSRETTLYVLRRGLKARGLVEQERGCKPSRWRRVATPSQIARAAEIQEEIGAPLTTPVYLTEAQIRCLLRMRCPRCGRVNGHREGCERDEDEAQTVVLTLRRRLATSFGASEQTATLRRVA